MCQENGWEALSLQWLFCIFWLTRKYNPLDYFGMGIIEEIRFFFFEMEDPDHNQKLYAEMWKIEKQGVWIVKKKRWKSTWGIQRKM